MVAHNPDEEGPYIVGARYSVNEGNPSGKALVRTIPRSINAHGHTIARLDGINLPAAVNLLAWATHFEFPLHGVRGIGHVEREADVRIAPVDPADRALQSQCLLRVVFGFQTMVRESRQDKKEPDSAHNPTTPLRLHGIPRLRFRNLPFR
jgi:hypothetical protein